MRLSEYPSARSSRGTRGDDAHAGAGAARPGSSRRLCLHIQGTVQGVGFRPYVHRLATALGLGGRVLNGAAGVQVEIEGPAEACEAFLERFPRELPPLARIETLAVKEAAARGELEFRIAPSEAASLRFTLVAPDIAVCPDCLAEMRNPQDRRFGYAFVNCTNCGPRFTLIRDLPYDRSNTTMSAFSMCPACLREYEDPADRRFHAEPTACPECGPVPILLDAEGRLLPGDSVREAATMLGAGRIVAVKGLGGFHLACDAADEDAVVGLRKRKRRDEKPFAVMVRSLEEARQLCAVSGEEAELLASPARPIVLLARRADPAAALAPSIAPGLREIGLMLPYTPLHHLLLDRCGRPLVMTSGNLSEEPIASRNGEALARLRGIADAFLVHRRDIHMRCDDSVARVHDGAPRLLRRSRGYAPAPLSLPWTFATPLLAVGGELKNAFCLGRDRFAFLSHHIGDLENEATLDSFESAVEHYSRLFQVLPEVVVHDLHPDYLSTRYALGWAGRARLVGVQHHHAHIAAVMAEHGLEGPVIGVAWDGTGFGTDGHLWGGEFLVCDLARFERAGHWTYFPLPGGSASIRQPWRTAVSLLLQRHGAAAMDLPLECLRRHAAELPPIRQMIAKGINAPLSCGVGRLFDAASALVTGRERNSYEGQAAIALEHLADPAETAALPVRIGRADGQWLPDSASLLAAVADDIAGGFPAATVAARFHNALAAAAVDVCRAIADATGLDRVVLGGGVFQNRLLSRRCAAALAQAGLTAHMAQAVPANDGGLALGQAVIGGRLSCV